MSSTVTLTQTEDKLQKETELESIKKILFEELTKGIPTVLPAHPGVDNSVPHAPKRPYVLSDENFKVKSSINKSL
jgi:hypothetical protein